MKNGNLRRLLLSAWMIMMAMLAAQLPALAEEVPPPIEPPKPTKIVWAQRRTKMIPGEIRQFQATVLPEGASQAIKWSSSNKKIAKITVDGMVTALKKGKVKITATVNKKLKKTFTLTVQTGFSGTAVRFYGIGNDAYAGPDAMMGNVDNVTRLAAKFGKAKYGGKKVETFVHTNQTAVGMAGVLGSIVQNTAIDDDDITIFYYSGHGVDEEDPQIRGALLGIDGQYLTVSDVQQALDMVQGNIVIMLDSCFSAQMIESKGFAGTTQAFNAAWVSALSRSSVSKAVMDSPFKHKYYLLTACANREEALEMQEAGGKKYGVFTDALLKVLDNQKKYDKNNDKRLTFKEAYAPVAKLVSDRVKMINLVNNNDNDPTNDTNYVMTVQAWPSASSPFPLYSWK